MSDSGSGPFGLSGRVVVVTGGAAGIGAGIAEVLAAAGATVVVADIDAEGAGRQARALVEAGHGADHVRIDLADEASLVAACDGIVSRHGTPWALVNNAALQDRELLLEGSVAEWDRVMAVNLRAPFLMMRELGRAMVAGGQGGRVVNIASAAVVGMVLKGHAAYASSKNGLLGLMRIGAIELAEHGITVNTVIPGGVLTAGAMTSKGPPMDGPGLRPPPLAMCEPRDIGTMVQFLVSDAARAVTNQSFVVDAGWSIS